MLTTFLSKSFKPLATSMGWEITSLQLLCQGTLTYNHHLIIGCKRDDGFAVIAADQLTMKGSTFGTQCVLQRDLRIALYENLVFPKEFGAVLFQQ